MRLLSSLTGAAIVAVAAVLLTLFAQENTQIASLSFLGAHVSGNIWWFVLGAAAIGFVLALLLVVPGHMATSYRAGNLSQLNAQHKQELTDLRDAHTQVQTERDRLTAEHAHVASETHTLRDELAATRGDRDVARSERDQVRAERDQLRDELSGMRTERERMVAERDQLRERLTGSPAVAPVNADGDRPAVEPALMGAVTPAMAAQEMGSPGDELAREETNGEDVNGQERMISSQAPEEPEMPGAEPVQATPAEEDQAMAREPAVTQPAQPSLGERLRAMVTGQPLDEGQAPDAQQDAQRDEAQAGDEPATGEPAMTPAEPVVTQPSDDRLVDHSPATDQADQMNDELTAQPSDQAETAQPEPMPTDTAEASAGEPDMDKQPGMAADEEQAQHEQDHEQSVSERPTLGDRLRALFHAPESEETPPDHQAESPEQPSA